MSIVNATAATFESEVLESNVPVLVDFWAEWCGPCKRFAPVFEAASNGHPDIVFGKINTEEQPALAQAAGVQGIPTLLIYREQIPLFHQAGALPPAAFADLINQVKDLDMDEVRAEIAQRQAEAPQD